MISAEKKNDNEGAKISQDKVKIEEDVSSKSEIENIEEALENKGL